MAAVETNVTIVVLTYNRAAEVVQTVRRLLRLPEQPHIIVVDNGSPDQTTQLLKAEVPTVQVIRLEKNIGAAARNIGVQSAQTPYVALCDDDTWWEPGALSRATHLLAAYPQLALISGRVVVGPEEREDPTCGIMAASPLSYAAPLPGPALLGFLAGATMIRRSAFLAVGGFEPRFFLGGEESLVALDLVAAGWALAYVDSIVIHHFPSSQRDALARRRLLHRNALWLAWLRRPLRSALRETGRLIRTTVLQPHLAPGFIQGLAGLGWVAQNRRVLPTFVETALRQLERG